MIFDGRSSRVVRECTGRQMSRTGAALTDSLQRGDVGPRNLRTKVIRRGQDEKAGLYSIAMGKNFGSRCAGLALEEAGAWRRGWESARKVV